MTSENRTITQTLYEIRRMEQDPELHLMDVNGKKCGAPMRLKFSVLPAWPDNGRVDPRWDVGTAEYVTAIIAAEGCI
jgi:hypothetical protein